MLIAHEAHGIGGNVRRHGWMLANIGYTVLAADIHGSGRVLEGSEMREALDRFRDDPNYLRARVRAGFDALAGVERVDANRVAAIGYCFGGFAVLELARSGAPVRAVASFHGLLTTRRSAEPGGIRASMAVFTGAKDPLVPPDDIGSFRTEMMLAHADWQMSIYGQALHSFTSEDVDGLGDPRMGYDRRAHRQSWAALLGFLDDALASGHTACRGGRHSVSIGPSPLPPSPTASYDGATRTDRGSRRAGRRPWNSVASSWKSRVG